MSMPCTSCLNPLFRGLHRVAWNCATTVADHGREYSTGKGKETLGQKFPNRQKKTYQLHHSRSSFTLPLVRRDTGFLAFLFPRSLGSGVYDKINGGQQKLGRTYLSYISTTFRPIWMSFGAHVSKTPCQTRGYMGTGLAQCFAYACTKTHPNQSKFGRDIAQISAHRFLLSSINFVINSTPQGPWERKGQKTRVTPY